MHQRKGRPRAALARSPGRSSPRCGSCRFNAAMAAADRYVPATGLPGLTRFYDSILSLTMRERMFRGRLREQVLDGLDPGARVADVGAGTGTFAIGLAAAAPGASVVAVDGDPEVLAIAAAKEGAAAVEWKRGLAG